MTTTLNAPVQEEFERKTQDEPHSFKVELTHNVPTLSRLTPPPEGENRPSVTGQRTGAHGWSITE